MSVDYSIHFSYNKPFEDIMGQNSTAWHNALSEYEPRSRNLIPFILDSINNSRRHLCHLLMFDNNSTKTIMCKLLMCVGDTKLYSRIDSVLLPGCF
jgi:hypothetical protein